jgi:hypothetical protein
MTVKINADTSDGLKLESDTSGEIDLQTNGTTKVHMDSSGNVGIGYTSLTSKLTVNRDQSSGVADLFTLRDGSAGATFNMQTYSDPSFGTANRFDFSGAYLAFRRSGTEAMRIDSSGTVFMGQTTNPATSTLVLKVSTGSANGVNAQITSNTGTSFAWSNYNASGSYVGGITCTSSSTAFPTSSDYRLKENVDYTFDATSRLKQLKPCRFNFIADTDNTVDGFLAHEVSSIVPEAIFGEKDAMETYTDDDGNEQTRISPQSIDQSKLVPLLVKTIQELEARITILENN